MTWKIQGITTELTGQSIIIDRDMLVGRHQDADVQLQLAEVSRRHAAFLLKDQELWLQDLNSSNGTFVNDARIAAETQLNDGDTVQFATVQFAVFEEQTVETSDPTETASVATVPETAEVEVEKAIAQPAEAVATSQHLDVAQGAQAAVTAASTPPETQVVTPPETVFEAAVETPVIKPTVEAPSQPQAQSQPKAQLQPEEQTQAEVAVETPVVAQAKVEPTAAAVLSDQGMPDVAERAAGTSISKEGMPEHVAIPKPAPIPNHVDIHAKVEAEVVEPVKSVTVPAPVDETKKNASVGLITIISLVILAILAWLLFK